MAPRKATKSPRKSTKAKKKPGAVRGRGRPPLYTPELAARLCSELAAGKSLRTVCKVEGMPSLETVFKWLHTIPDFAEHYARAKAESADALVEEMLDIADDGTNDWQEVHGKDGESAGWKVNGEAINRSRLRVDTRKWIASKLKPKKFGERLDMTHGTNPDNPLTLLIQSIQGNSLPITPTHAIEHYDEDDA